MAWLEEWANAATDLKDRLEREPQLHSCGTRMVLGYSNLGVGIAACPKCSPELIRNARRPIGDVMGEEAV